MEEELLGGLGGSSGAGASGILGLLGQAGSDAVDNYFTQQQMGTQYGYNQNLAAYQNELNMQSWMQQQQYNTPANQMARYKAAGLNPYLIYGQGNNGNAQSPVELSAGQPRQAFKPSFRKSIAALGGAADSFIDRKMKLKQYDILSAEADIKNADAQVAHDRDIQSAYFTYGAPMRFARSSKTPTGEQASFATAPYYRLMDTQLNAKTTDFDRKMLELRLQQNYADAERSLQLSRDKQAFELEKYANDPLFYFGGKLLDKASMYLPVPKYNKSVRGMSDSEMINQMRGKGFSVRKQVY